MKFKSQKAINVKSPLKLILFILVLFACYKKTEPNDNNNSNITDITDGQKINTLIVGCKEKCPKGKHTKFNSHTIDIVDETQELTKEQEYEDATTGKISSEIKIIKNPPTYLFDITNEKAFKETLLNSDTYRNNGLYGNIIFEYLPNATYTDNVFKRFKNLLKPQGTLKISGIPYYLLEEKTKKAIGPLFWSTYDSTDNKNFYSKFVSFDKEYSYSSDLVQNPEDLWLRGAPYTINQYSINFSKKEFFEKINQKYKNLPQKEKDQIKRKNDKDSKHLVEIFFKSIGLKLEEVNLNSRYILLKNE